MIKKSDKKTLILLDAHAIIHRAYHALPDFSSSKGEPTGALYGLSAMLIKIIWDLKPDYLIACYDLPEKTFRHDAYDNYKAGREKISDDLIHQLEKSKEVFKSFSIPVYAQSGFEADDILGKIVEKTKNKKDLNIIIASGDLDTLQLINDKKVQVYTLRKGLNDTILYDEKAVKDRFGFAPELLVDYKGLRGDPSDNIIGISGIGEKTASSLITNFGSLENIYKIIKKDSFELIKAGIKPRVIELLRAGEDEAFFSKTLARIRRDAPIKFSLPNKEWKETIKSGNIETLFRELGFKSLQNRFNQLFGIIENPNSKDQNQRFLLQTSMASQEKQKEEKEIGVALWLLSSNLSNPTLEDILEFENSHDFNQAKNKILKKIKEEKLEYVYKNIELPIIPIIEEMEKHGILIDLNYIKKLSIDYHQQLEKLEHKIWEEAGGKFNINSPKQMAEILFDKLKLIPLGDRIKKTKGGARSTRISELEKLIGTHKIIDEIIDYRELQKLLSTYIDVIPRMTEKDNRLHAKFIQTGTTTGRFSSVSPNLQNIPIRSDLGKKIRNAFIASPNHKLIAFDYSQIELRIAALLSQDKYFLQIFTEKKDIHNAVASRVFGVSEEKVDPEMRRQAKVINFGIIYGMGVLALQKTLKSNRAEAKKFYDDYFQKFPRLIAYLEEIKDSARKNGYTETLFGRRRYFPEIKSKLPFIRAMAERMAINAPIQGTSADIIKLAISQADKVIIEAKLKNKCHLVLQVHDELIYEVDEKIIHEAVKIIKSAMEKNISQEFLKNKKEVPITTDISIGSNWGEMTKIRG